MAFKNFALICSFLFFAGAGFAQEENPIDSVDLMLQNDPRISLDIQNIQERVDANRNLIYLEAAGIGGWGSLNYEYLLDIKNFQTGWRIGLSTYHVKDFTNAFNPDIIVPFSINSYFGFRHKLHLGIGATYSSIVQADPSSFDPARVVRMSTNGIIGYRFMNYSGFIIGLTYLPVLEFNERFLHWGALQVGFSF